MSTTPPQGPVRSTFSDDPEMHELVVFFVQEVPSRVDDMQRAWASQDAEMVERIAHQLKGAGGGYGFQVISDAAKALELPLKSGESALDDLKAEFEALVDLCNRVML